MGCVALGCVTLRNAGQDENYYSVRVDTTGKCSGLWRGSQCVEARVVAWFSERCGGKFEGHERYIIILSEQTYQK